MTTPSTLAPYMRSRQRIASPITGLDQTSPVDTLAYDTFTDSDGTNLTAHTMDVGGGWSALSGSMTVQSNAAVCQSATTVYATEVGRSDVTVTCKVKVGATNANYGPSILLRGADINNWLLVNFSGDGAVWIYKKVAGSLTAIDSAYGGLLDTNWHDAKVVCEDTRLIVYLDNVLVMEDDVPLHSGNTLFGIYGFVSGGLKDSFDDFKVTAKRRRNDTFPGKFIANLLTDSFTGADTTRLNTFGWTENNGQWQISGNKATQVLTTAPTAGYVVTRDAGRSDVALEVKITTPASGAFICGLVFRSTDRLHYVEAELNSGVSVPGFALWYYINGAAFIEIARNNSFTPANSTTYTMRVMAEGENITAEIVEEGVILKARCEVNLHATRVGLFEARTPTYVNANLYDDFKVYLY